MKMDFEKRRREVNRMDESKIFPNRHVLVSMVGRETEENVPLEPLILTPPGKIVDNCLLLGFHRHFFCICVPDIISKLKYKKLPVGTTPPRTAKLSPGAISRAEGPGQVSYFYLE